MSLEVPILLYHDIADEGPPETAAYRVPPARFREQMQLLRANGFQSMTLEEWADCVSTGRDPGGRRVIITFDDGFRNVFRNALPALVESGLRATIFVVTGRVGEEADWDAVTGPKNQLMSWVELADWLRCGNSVGSHCTRHVDLMTLSESEIVHDSHAARDAIKSRLGVTTEVIAYPWGRSDDRARKTLSEAGYRIGVGVSGGTARPSDDMMRLPRIEVFAEDDLTAFGLKVGIDLALQVSRRTKPASMAPRPRNTESLLTELRTLHGRITPLVKELDAIKAELLRLAPLAPARAPRNDPLHMRTMALFAKWPEGSGSMTLRPNQDIAPGICFNCSEGGRGDCRSLPAKEGAVTRWGVTNSLQMTLADSNWYSIEIPIEDSELGSANRYDITLSAACSPRAPCLLMLRKFAPDGNQDIELSNVFLEAGGGEHRVTGAIDAVDRDKLLQPGPTRMLVLIQTSPGELEWRLDYLTIFFPH